MDSNLSIKEDWEIAYELDEALKKAVESLSCQKRKKDLNSYPRTIVSKVLRAWNNAGMGKTTFESYIEEVAKKIGVSEQELSTSVVVNKKDLDRLAEKIRDENRNPHDAVRGRILVPSAKEIENLRSLFFALKGSKSFHDEWCRKNRPVTVIDVADYIKKRRRSGYCMAIHIDVEIPDKNGQVGKFEIQVMHKDAQETYDQSHILYEKIIRTIDETPEIDRTTGQELLRDIIVKANGCSCHESLLDTGLTHLTKQGPPTISEEELNQAGYIFTALSDGLAKRFGSNPMQAQKEILDAVHAASLALSRQYYREKGMVPPTTRGHTYTSIPTGEIIPGVTSRQARLR